MNFSSDIANLSIQQIKSYGLTGLQCYESCRRVMIDQRFGERYFVLVAVILLIIKMLYELVYEYRELTVPILARYDLASDQIAWLLEEQTMQRITLFLYRCALFMLLSYLVWVFFHMQSIIDV